MVSILFIIMSIFIYTLSWDIGNTYQDLRDFADRIMRKGFNNVC